MLNVRKKTTLEIFIFTYEDYLYKAELDYGENTFKVRNINNRIVLYWQNISRTQLDEIEKELNENKTD